MIALDPKRQAAQIVLAMPNTAAEVEDTKKLLIFIEVVDKPEIHVGIFSTPPGLDKDGTDHITVSLNKANPAVAKSLAESDHEDIMRLVNWALIHHVCDWTHHYQLGAIREHVWTEAGKTKEEMDSQPGFFDIAYTKQSASKTGRRAADLWRQSKKCPNLRGVQNRRNRYSRNRARTERSPSTLGVSG